MVVKFSPEELERLTFANDWRDVILNGALKDADSHWITRCFAQTGNSCGLFDMFPPEIVHQIFRQIDLNSLMAFRTASKKAYKIVEDLPPFVDITTHAPIAIRAIIAVDAGGSISCDSLVSQLCSRYCKECGDLGCFLYIPTCKRICFPCLTMQPEYVPIPLNYASRDWGIPQAVAETLPRIRSVPGKYGMPRKLFSEPLLLVDAAAVNQAAAAVHGSIDDAEVYTARIWGCRMDMYQQKKREYDEALGKQKKGETIEVPAKPISPEEDVDLEGVGSSDHHTTNPLRYMAILHFPWLDRSTNSLRKGFNCEACANSGWCECNGERYNDPRREYDEALFIKHIEEVGRIVERDWDDQKWLVHDYGS